MQFINDYEKRINEKLETYLDKQTQLTESMHYSIFNGGKRLRPLLIYVTGKSLGIELEKLDAIACAVECIHCYSLIHDDLPAMDNANLRRGKLSCHKKFDEATAILSGDALLTIAFEILSSDQKLSATQNLKLIQSLASSSGMQGMIEGQALDLAASHQLLSYEELKNLNNLKTGKLFHFCILSPLLILENPTKILSENLEKFAYCIGLIYQIQDDILDIEGETKQTGKTKNIDKKNKKTTIPDLIGLTEAKSYLKKLFENSQLCLKNAGLENSDLNKLTDYLYHRTF